MFYLSIQPTMVFCILQSHSDLIPGFRVLFLMLMICCRRVFRDLVLITIPDEETSVRIEEFPMFRNL